MKKFLLMTGLLMFVLTLGIQAQTLDKDVDKAAKKAEKEARKLKEKLENEMLFEEAKKALDDQAFVLEADRIVFKRGSTAFVSSNTNFISLVNGRATVQIAFNTAYAGPNGIGGITVDGTASNVKMSTDKRGNINFSMNVSGIGVSAQVNIQLTEDTNYASVTVSPNFNSNRITLTGKLLPVEKSDVFKGRAL